jgi:cytochrome P450
MAKSPDQTKGSGPASHLFDPAITANPYPLYAQLRAGGALVALPTPLVPTGGAAWAVTRYPEAVQVLKDPRFTVDASAVYPNAGAFGRSASAAEEASFLGGKTMLTVDGKEHARLRGLVSKAFTPRYVENLRPRIQEIADSLLDQVQPQRRMDVVSHYAYPLPISVISEMLGVRPEHREQVRGWSAGFSTFEPEAMRAFGAYVSRLIAEKREHASDDLLSTLIQTEESGEKSSEQELLATAGLLIFAGHETTSNLIGIGTLMLLDNPDQLALLREHPEHTPAALEELLRFNGPVFSAAPRHVVEDAEIGGQLIRRGDQVVVLLGSANHDDREFTDPDELDIARQLSQHVGFGHGIHYCLGAPLARLEGKIAFTTLLRRLPELRLAVPRENIVWRNSVNLRGLRSLPAEF